MPLAHASMQSSTKAAMVQEIIRAAVRWLGEIKPVVWHGCHTHVCGQSQLEKTHLTLVFFLRLIWSFFFLIALPKGTLRGFRRACKKVWGDKPAG